MGNHPATIRAGSGTYSGIHGIARRHLCGAEAQPGDTEGVPGGDRVV